MPGWGLYAPENTGRQLAERRAVGRGARRYRPRL